MLGNKKKNPTRTSCMANIEACSHSNRGVWFSWKWRTTKNKIWNLRKTESTDWDTCLNILMFLSFQIKCTRRARETRLNLCCNLLLRPDRPLTAEEREDIERFIRSQCLIRLHKREDQSQLKNKWAWDSSS